MSLGSKKSCSLYRMRDQNPRTGGLALPERDGAAMRAIQPPAVLVGLTGPGIERGAR